MTPEEEELLKLTGSGDNTQNTGNSTPPPPPPPPPPAPQPQPHNYDSFWKKADVKAPQTIPPVTPGGGTTPPAPGGPAAPGQVKVTKEAIEMGARTAVSTINLAQVTLFRPLMNWRFKKEGAKRFGAENFEKGLDSIITGDTPTDPAETARKKRIMRFLEQRDSKVKGIPFTDEEEGDLTYAFKTYFELKQVPMSPEVLLYCSLGSILGKRGIDMMMWD